MTTTNCSHTPESLTKLATSAAYDGAVTAFDLLAKAVQRVQVGSGSEEARKGAEAMRAYIVHEVKKLAAEFRGGGGGAPTCQGRL